MSQSPTNIRQENNQGNPGMGHSRSFLVPCWDAPCQIQSNQYLYHLCSFCLIPDEMSVTLLLTSSIKFPRRQYENSSARLSVCGWGPPPPLTDISEIRGFWSVIPHHNLRSPHPFLPPPQRLFTPSSFHHPMVIPSDSTCCGPTPLWRNGQWADGEQRKGGDGEGRAKNKKEKERGAGRERGMEDESKISERRKRGEKRLAGRASCSFVKACTIHLKL